MAERLVPRSSARRLLRPALAGAVAAVLTLTVGLVAVLPAQADTAPPSGTPETVTADALPTVQIDGVAWSQAVVGKWVYVGGSFSTARPAGAAPGENTVPRQNLLRYDVATGELDSTWAPAANAQVRAVVASPDGSRLYVGGDFTNIAGVNRYRLAAFDAATGALVTGFNGILDYQVRALAATNTTVYAGGAFSKANNEPRAKVAAFAAANGSLLPWNPSAGNGSVSAMAISPDEKAVMVGGSFTSFNGSSNPGYGLARVDATTGAMLPLPANSVIRNGTSSGAILDLKGDGDNVYAVGYTWGRSGGTLEGTAAIRWSDGQLVWVADCHGDSYSVFPHGDAVYNASHAHYCGNIGSMGQTDPHSSWTYYRGIALTKEATRVVGREPLGYTNFEGKPGPTVLNFFPEIDWGTYTGQNQGAWSISGNTEYVVFGGEFRNVNFRPQQGLVRFAVKSTAPNKMGARFSGTNFPVTAEPIADGAVRISWQANADPDNEALVYRVIRNNATGSPVHVGTYTSQMWNRPMMGFTDTGLTPGASYSYRVTVTDPFGNVVSSPTVSVTADGSGPLSSYAQTVMGDGASHYWRMGETSGATASDMAATNDGSAGSGVTFGVPGAIAGDSDTAADLGTSSGGWAQSNERYLSTNYFSVETWIKARSNDRGRILGFGDSNSLTGNSSQRDRHLYLDGQGRINFGIYPAEYRVITSPGSYNDDTWHHVVGTMGADGLRLYVDGKEVASRTGWTVAGNYFGYWRVGGDGLSGWPNRPSGDYYGGLVDEVAIYPDALPASVVQRHYELGTTGSGANQAPVASFASSVSGLSVAVDGSGSSDPDGSIASYAWNFGDGSTASGVKASRTYAAAGTYTVTLTVTDDAGAKATESKQVTVAGEGDGGGGGGDSSVFARDAFERAVSSGWGSADAGGSWSLAGTASNFSVGDGVGRIALASAGAGRGAFLTEVSQRDVDVTVRLAVDKAATGSGTDAALVARRTASNTEYQSQVKFLSTGGVRLTLRRLVSNAATTLTQVNVPGLTYTPGQQLNVRLQVVGASPTTLRTKVWPVGTSEPSAWTLETTDSTTALQNAGALGLSTYLASNATNAPVTVSFDELTAAPAP